jgi:hypothetical protein
MLDKQERKQEIDSPESIPLYGTQLTLPWLDSALAVTLPH